MSYATSGIEESRQTAYREIAALKAELAAERAKVERLKGAINEIRAISQANDFKTFTEIAKDALKECQ